MALVVNDRVRETSTTTGTGTLSLAGAATGFETFVAGIGNSNTTYYAISNQANGEFEVGIGTVTDAAPDTLARTTIISSSNSDSAVDFSAGTKDVFCTLPASKAVILDASGNIVANNGSNLTALNASNISSGTLANARLPATISDKTINAARPLTVKGDGSSADGQLILNCSQNSHGVKITSPAHSANATWEWVLPVNDGTSGQVLTTDGNASAQLSWTTPEVGDITAVTAGTGLSGGGNSGDVTLNVDLLSKQGGTNFSNSLLVGHSTTGTLSSADNNTGVGIASLDALTSGQGNTALGKNSGTSLTTGASNLFIGQAAGELITDATGCVAVGNNALGDADAGNNNIAIGESAGKNITGVRNLTIGQGAGDNITSGSGSVIIGSGVDAASATDNRQLKIAGFDGSTTTNWISGTNAGAITFNGAYTFPTADGSAGKVLTTDGSGALTFETPTTGDITSVVAGSGLTGGATSGAATLNVGAGNLIDVQADQIDVDLSELSTSTSNGDGDFFCVVDSSNGQKKLTKGNINNSGFNNDAGFTTNTGTVTSVGITPGTGLDAGSAVTGSGTISVDLDLSELTDMTATMTGSDEFIVLDSSAERRKAASEIGLSIFNNDAGFTTNTGDITGVTAGTLLDGGGTSGSVTLNVDLSELSTSTSNGDGDFFCVVDSSNAQKKLTKGNINNSGFNNDAGYTTNTGDITSVVAGSGLTGGATSGAATLNIGAGTGIDVAADAISVDVSDFMANGSNNRIVTATGADAQNAEANLTFDGSTLDVSGTLKADKGYVPEATLTDGSTINWNMSTQSVCKVTLAGNRTMAAPSNGSTGQFASITVIQDGTGSRTLTWNAAYEFAADTAPTLSTTANKADLFVFRYNGSKWLEVGRNLLLTVS